MFKLVFLLFFVFRVYSQNNGLESILKHHDDFHLHPDLEPLMTSIILKTGNCKCLAIICDEIYQNVFGSYFYDQIRDVTFFKIIIANTEDLISPNYNTLATIRRIRRNGCQTYVILLANGQQVKRFLRFGDKYRDLDVRANFILLYDDRLFESDIHYLWKKIVNVIFIRKFSARTGSSNWYEISSVPFPAPIRDILIPRRLDTWRNGYFYSNTELFRDKTSNLRNQIFKVITFQHVPSAFKMPAPVISSDIILQGTEPIGYTGLEIEMLNALATVMNFAVDVYDVSVNEKWGVKQVNGSFSGLLGEIVSGRADIALGNLYYTPYHLDLMDLTIPYITQCLTFLTPESLADNSWETLLLPFRGYLWAGVFISLVAGGFFFFVLAKFHKFLNIEPSETPNSTVIYKSNNLIKAEKSSLNTEKKKPSGIYLFEDPINSYLYTYSMLLLVSLPKLPEGWSLRLFTGWWWIYCILLVVAYRASMTSILANPKPRVTIDTLDQLAESQIGAGGWGEEIKRFFQTSLDASGKKIGSKFEIIYDTEEAVERVADGTFAYYENIFFLRHASVHRRMVMLEQEAQTGKSTDNGTPTTDRSLHIMKDCVINMPISIGLQKNSPLKTRIDKYLQMIVEAGLVKKWLNDAMAQVLIADMDNGEEPVKALMDFKKLHAAFITLAIGYGLGICIFICEMLVWHIKVTKNPLYDKYSNRLLTNKTVTEVHK